MDIVFLIGRVLLAAIFLLSAVGHFTQTQPMAQYAASKGVPAPAAGVIVSGLIGLVGALSIVLGIWPDLGALLLIAFLVPVSLFMHPFWKETDPQARQGEQINFMKNVGLIGGALILFYVVNQTQDVAAAITSSPLFGRW